MQEEKACQEEVTFQEQEEEEETDAEMVGEGECGDGEPSGPQGVAGTEDAPPLDPTGDAVSPEEDAFLMQQASQPVDPAAGSHSPRSKAGTVSGGMVELSLTSPSQPGPGEDETQQWVSTSVSLVFRVRLPSGSLPFAGWGTRSESSVASPGKRLKKEVGEEDDGDGPVRRERGKATTSCYPSYLV